MHISEIEISNILSIEHLVYQFKDNGLFLLQGYNFDEDRANGAGKSAMFNSLCFALYNEMPRKITATEIIRRSQKKGHVRVNITCKTDKWTVIRSRPKGVIFKKNDIVQNISQEEFERVLQMTYSQFLLTMYIPQFNSGELKRFLDCSDSDKKIFILQLLNLEKFSNYKKTVDTLIKDLQLQIDQHILKSSSLNSKLEVYKENLLSVSDIEIIKANSSLVLDNIKNIDNEIGQLLLINRPDLSKYLSMENNIKLQLNTIQQNKFNRTQLLNDLKRLQSTIAEYDVNVLCSECGASRSSETAHIAHDNNQKHIRSKHYEIEQQVIECNQIIAKESSFAELSKKLTEKKNQDSVDYHAASIRLVELKENSKSLKLQIETGNSKIKANEITISKVTEIENVIATEEQTLKEKKTKLELYKTVSMICSSTGAPAYVLDSIVDSFNEKIQSNIDILWSSATYSLNSFKENVNGDITAKFSETLMIDGDRVSIGSLSGGEYKGLSLCIDFTLLDLMETQFGISLNPIILDEPFDGLDATGREIVIGLLQKLSEDRQIIIVDHVAEAKTLFNNIITIEKRGGVSSLREEQ